jgi:hypothetical protein
MPGLNELREYLRIDECTGKLFWVKTKNSKWPAGREAATSFNGPRGYKVIGWDGKRYLAHRVIYYMTHGVDPGELCVDHINGDVFDNRPVNLRLATFQQNSQNMARPMRNNKSGVLGVHWSSQNKSWCAKLTVDGKQMCRFFQNFDDAVAAIKELRLRHYGDFAGGTKKCA